ncbi:hypothetical protein RISK_003518 [Rhodopirellula islandica]|uniref:Uncharacterized protein n=1 Tax=Rhodopirellula islandica TaxID=595434 RepID=A0A0J1EG28_RHOIS|nr:hypothetical protein RISK_003518 [Rhodopirellula islandica]
MRFIPGVFRVVDDLKIKATPVSSPGFFCAVSKSRARLPSIAPDGAAVVSSGRKPETDGGQQYAAPDGAVVGGFRGVPR